MSREVTLRRKRRKASVGGQSVLGSTAKAAPKPRATAEPHSLSSNIQGLRFMQSARENEERKKPGGPGGIRSRYSIVYRIHAYTI